MAYEHRFRRPLPKFPAFEETEASREKYEDLKWHLTQTQKPDWKVGEGANNSDSKKYQTVELDPNDVNRDPIDNYSIMISGIIPRPIGFVSTVSADGKSTNLAPFSYTQMVNHDPPVIVIGFSGGSAHPKNTLQNILETKQCTVNMINEDMVEAANFCSIDAPHGVSEWPLSGLTPAPSRLVKPTRVAESRFTIECKLMFHHDFQNSYGENTGAMVVLEGIWFHVREDCFTNEDQNVLREDKLQAISRLGGITYGRVIEGFEIPRPMFKHLSEEDQKKFIKPKVEGQ